VVFVALAATAAWQILVRRRPVAGLVSVGVGLAYRWTVEPPGSAALAGALALAGLAAVLALASWEGGGPERAVRRVGGAVALGGVAMILAASVGAGPAQAGDPWWAWKDWELGAGDDASGPSLDLSQGYGKLDWPAEPRVALTVDSDRPMPLRALSLDEFNGVSFDLSQASRRPGALPIENGVIRLEPDETPGQADVVQGITMVGAASRVLLVPARPAQVTGPLSGTADIIGDGINLAEPVGPGDRYSVQAVLPQPTPSQLVAATPYEPDEVPASETALRGRIWADEVEIPLWGSGEPAPADELLGPYAEVRALARQVTGDAETPYAAVNRIESYLRRRYVYDEQPPYPTSAADAGPADWPEDQPPLVDFLFNSRRGFCQHFAGSMAVMLRSVGIPARVAVGYAAGTFDSEAEGYVVLDRDAHSWVEVWFPGYGWLPFDPTPGRAAPNPSSVSSPNYAPTQFEINLSGLARSSIDPPPDSPAAPEPLRELTGAEPEPSPSPSGGGAPWELALLALGLPALVAPVGRAARRARGRRGGDERARVVAAVHELEASLRALGWEPAAAGTPSQRAAAVRARTGVDPSGLYRRAARARFSPEPPPAGAGAAAWGELARLRRAIRRGAPLGRRVRAAVGLGGLRRGTVHR